MVTAPERRAASHPGPWTECPAGPRQRGRLGWIRGSHAERRGLLLPTVAEHVGAPQPAPCSCSARVCCDLEVPSKSPQSQFCCAAHPRVNIPPSQTQVSDVKIRPVPSAAITAGRWEGGLNPRSPAPSTRPSDAALRSPLTAAEGRQTGVSPGHEHALRALPPAMAAQFPDKRSRDGPVTFIYFHSVGAPELLIHKNFWHVLSVNKFVYI